MKLRGRQGVAHEQFGLILQLVGSDRELHLHSFEELQLVFTTHGCGYKMVALLNVLTPHWNR